MHPLMFEDELREMVLPPSAGDVCAMAVTNDYCIWVLSTGELFVWDRRQTPPLDANGDDASDKNNEAGSPQCLATLGFSPPPHLIAATEDGEVVMVNGAHVGIYAIERHLRADNRAGSSPTELYTYPDVAQPLREELVLREVFVIPCRVHDASHLAFARDGSTAAISTPSELVLVDCRALTTAESAVYERDGSSSGAVYRGGDCDDPSTSPFIHTTAAPASILRIDASGWFSAADAADAVSRTGCSCTCFISAAHLAVLGPGNHLVRVMVDWVEGAVWLVRDGHVVTPTQPISAIAARDGVIAAAVGDGTVKLLRADTLEIFRTVDAVGELRALHRRHAGAPASGSLPRVRWPRGRNGRQERAALAYETPGGAVEGHVRGRKTLQSLSSPAGAATYSAVKRWASSSSESRSAEQRPPLFSRNILGVAAGRGAILVATDDAVLRVSLDTFAVDEDSVCYLISDEALQVRAAGFSPTTTATHRVACVGDGSWAAFAAKERVLLYFVALPVRTGTAMFTQSSRPGDAQEMGEEYDIIHSQAPLPRTLRVAAEAMVSATATVNSVAETSMKTGGRTSTCSTAVGAVSKPVTSGHPIKSSGYGQQVPWSVQEERRRAAAQRAKRSPFGGARSEGAGPPRYAVAGDPYDAHAFTQMASTNRALAANAAVHRSAVLSSTFTAAGAGLVTTSSVGAYFLKLPVSKYHGDGVTLQSATVHDGVAGLQATTASSFLTCATNLSLRAPIIATGSADGVIQLWKPSSAGAGARRSANRCANGGAGYLRSGEAPVVTHRVEQRKEVRDVRFFYMDKFLAYSAGATLSLSAYSLDERRRETSSAAAELDDDLNRFRNASRIGAAVYTYRADAQQITSMDCVNHFASSLVVVAASNKEISVLDVCAGRPLRTIPDAHKRTIHKVVLGASAASRFLTPPAPTSIQHLFASAAIDGAVTLWDLRQTRPLRQFALHRNAALTSLGLAFHPTGSMLAVGSEDRAVYLYDIANGKSSLDALKCADVPTSIAFHPVDAVMAVGLASGAVILYAQK